MHSAAGVRVDELPHWSSRTLPAPFQLFDASASCWPGAQLLGQEATS